MTDAVAALAVGAEVERVPIAEEHVVAAVDRDHRGQRLAFVGAEDVTDDLATILSHPVDSVWRGRVPDLIRAVGLAFTRVATPACAEDVPHVVDPLDLRDESIADQVRLVQGRGEHRPSSAFLEANAVVAADGKADGGFYGYRNPPAPPAGIGIKGIAASTAVHREDAVFVETAEPAERDHRLLGDPHDVAEVLAHVDEAHMTQVLPRLVARSGRVEDSHEVVEHDRLRRLRPSHAP